jgi:chromosome segregation ATPase
VTTPGWASHDEQIAGLRRELDTRAEVIRWERDKVASLESEVRRLQAQDDALRNTILRLCDRADRLAGESTCHPGYVTAESLRNIVGPDEVLEV